MTASPVSCCQLSYIRRRPSPTRLPHFPGATLHTVPVPPTVPEAPTTPLPDPALRALESGRRRVIAFFPDLRVRELSAEEFAAIDPTGRSARNVNTPEEFARAAAELRSDG